MRCKNCWLALSVYQSLHMANVATHYALWFLVKEVKVIIQPILEGTASPQLTWDFFRKVCKKPSGHKVAMRRFVNRSDRVAAVERRPKA